MRNTSTDLVLLQIAEGLQNLAKNPDLSKTITDAYALSEAERKTADESREFIAKADTLRAELKQREDAIADINERIAKAESVEAFNGDTFKLLNTKQNELDNQQKANEVVANANKAAQTELDKFQDLLDERESALLEGERNLEISKADLKKRSEIVTSQLAGL